MHRQYCWIAALLLLTGQLYFVEYAPESHVWNNDPILLQQITPPLRKVFALHLLVLGGIGLVGLRLLARPWRGQTWVALLLLGGGLLTSQLLPYCLATDYYTIWKYELKTEEYSELAPPVLSARVVSCALQDLNNPAEPARMRSRLALMLGEARVQAAYPALVALASNPQQNPYLRFHCLKSVRRLRPQQFAIVLRTVPNNSAVALYRQYQ
ncbi:MAG TPA: hypothetical protein VFO93_04875 [Hymenobacter sp.]|uniref:hypothetical protein n=1 Tax=Hymenobacter sp. TaxID=1898978 RepID=UPI002D7F1245|nr:hypothetical protein [Hymenobacter sp.]HET9502850.1 hypothetical protein [Hymenobacter sp.]